MSYNPWGCKESDMTEFLSTQEPHTLHKNKKVHKRWVNLNIIPWLPQRHRCLKSRVGTKGSVTESGLGAQKSQYSRKKKSW